MIKSYKMLHYQVQMPSIVRKVSKLQVLERLFPILKLFYWAIKLTILLTIPESKRDSRLSLFLIS